MDKNWQNQRKNSYFYNMRRFHNYVKRGMYNKYSYGKSVLELSVGKLGDASKLFDNNVNKVVGYDIDARSIQEARRRLAEYPKEFQDKVELSVLDLSTNVISGNQSFDVISVMFALHYFFRDESSLLTILHSIDNNITIGGYLIGTMFNGMSLVQRLQKPFNDPHFKMKRIHQTNSIVGNTINVSLVDTNTSAEIYNPENEYIVDFERFTKIMETNGYELVETKMFHELYENKYKLNKVERDVSFLNRMFIFKKLYNVDKNLSV